jgi:KDO2-lipid IV(A) lauroyltransferase
MLRFVMGALARLPLRALHAVGAALGWLVYVASPSYRRHLRANLAQAGYSVARVRRAAIASAGRMFVELPAIWLRPREDVLRWIVQVEGERLIDEARARGRALVFLTPHQGCFEIAGQFLAERVPITFLYRPPKLASLQPMMEGGRAQGKGRLAPADLGGVKELLGALRRGEAVGILPDQAPGAGEGEWIDFFGRPAYTMTLAAKLASRENSTTLLIFAERLPQGRGYAVRLKPLPPALPGESAMRRINRAIESQIRDCPEQYLWGYNRYKSPRGAKPRPTQDARG